MKKAEHLKKTRALWLLIIPIFIVLPTSIFFLIMQNRLFEVETLIFGTLALICSILTGLRFWDVYYRLPWRNKDVDPFGLYSEIIGQAKSAWERGIDWAISIIGGSLIAFSLLPKCWFITAFILYLTAFLRHTTALKREDWRKETPSVTIGKIDRFLKEKQRGNIIYMALFCIGIIAAWKPDIINSLLTWITKNPKYIVVIWIILILVFRYIFRFIQERHEREKIRMTTSEMLEPISKLFKKMIEIIEKDNKKEK